VTDLFEEFIHKQHRNVEEVLEDIYEMRLYEDEILEDDDYSSQLDDLLQNIKSHSTDDLGELPASDQPVIPDTPDIPSLNLGEPSGDAPVTPDVPDMSSTDLGVPPDQPPLDTVDVDADTDVPPVDADPNLNLGDVPGPDANQGGTQGADMAGSGANPPADKEESKKDEDEDPEESDDPETIKKIFVSHVQELVKFRDILDDLINKTADSRFTKVRKLVMTVLDAISKEGPDILNNPKLKQINKDLSLFLIDAIGKVKVIVDSEYIPTNTKVDMNAEIKNLDDAKFGEKETPEEQKGKANEGGASKDVPTE